MNPLIVSSLSEQSGCSRSPGQRAGSGFIWISIERCAAECDVVPPTFRLSITEKYLLTSALGQSLIRERASDGVACFIKYSDGEPPIGDGIISASFNSTRLRNCTERSAADAVRMPRQTVGRDGVLACLVDVRSRRPRKRSSHETPRTTVIRPTQTRPGAGMSALGGTSFPPFEISTLSRRRGAQQRLGQSEPSVRAGIRHALSGFARCQDGVYGRVNSSVY